MLGAALTQREFGLQPDGRESRLPLKVVGVGVEGFRKLRQESADQLLIPGVLNKDLRERRKIFNL